MFPFTVQVLVESANVMLFNDEQEAKAYSPIEVTFSGIVTLVSEVLL